MMTGQLENLIGPGAAPTSIGRPSGSLAEPRGSRNRRLVVMALGFCMAIALAGSALGGIKAKNLLPDGIVADIRIEGNATISADKIRAKIKSRKGLPLDQKIITQDIQTLMGSRWFSDAKIDFEPAPGNAGYVLIYTVVEMPRRNDVEFLGYSQVKLKDIEDACQLKKGSYADTATALQAVHRIEELYRQKGFEKAEVKLLEGGRSGDSRIVIQIFEGPKFKINSITFIGNTFVDDGILGTKVESRRGFFGVLGARRSPESFENDRRALIKYYQDNGFFDVEIAGTVRHASASLGSEDVTYTISEGPRYRVRSIKFEGSKKIDQAKLAEGLMLKVGDPFNENVRDIDYKSIICKYWAIGCIDTKIEKDQPVTEEPGLIDVVYRIEEGEPYVLGQLIYKGNARTKEKVFRREALMAGLLPGEVLDLNRLDLYKQRVLGTGYVIKDPNMGKPLDIQIINKRSGDKPYGEDVFFDPNSVISAKLQNDDREADPLADVTPPPRLNFPAASKSRKRPTYVSPAAAREAEAFARRDLAAESRMQSAEPEFQLPGDPPSLPPIEVNPPTAAPSPGLSGGAAAAAAPSEVQPGGPTGLMPFGGVGESFAPPENSLPAEPSTPAQPGAGVRPPSPLGPAGSGYPDPARFPNLPNDNMNKVGPDANEPFPNRAFADIVTNLDEAPTGRLMLGVGASSFGGLSGNIILHESNFDLFAIPRSFSEMFSGRAFRGAGQEFRVELSPGTLINRYVVSFREPYLFNLPIGLGVSGYQWSRYYPDWTEQRSGGRASLGYQFGPQVYADVAARVEDVNIHGFKYPAPADVLAVQGHSTLVTVRPSLRFDNRNNPTSPTTGSYFEAAFEQGFGSFTFPKVTLEGRQHFTTGSRPDGSGKRTLALRGFFGASGRDTPIYERFYAGDFRSMRGFYYRGVGPHVLGVNTGGILTAIGSVEYQFPWNASETLQQVFFCDFGTVEADYQFTTIRAAVGTGIRVVIPQLTGQLPLAFDLAYPVSKAEGDRTRPFTFFIGTFW